MARLIGIRDEFDIAFANDTDADRHGIVTPSTGLMNPNHYLATAISYLFGNRPGWTRGPGVGKTIVSSGIIDRVAAGIGCKLVEVPVGFKWFVSGLLDGSLGFGGEESAGASFLRRDGSVWSTDKDGLILALLASEILAVTGLSPSQRYQELTAAPGNGAALGGLKVTTANAWFAARPSGTEDVYKIYAESFNGPEHLAEVQESAREVVNKVIG